jgi:hypothetical protein
MLLFTTQAQYVGFKGGLTFSRANLDHVSSESFRFGYHAGILYNIPLNEAISIQPEVLLSTKGTRADYSTFGLDGRNSLNFTYIDVPVLGVLELGERFELMAGPYIGFLIGTKFLTEVDQTSTNISIARDSFRTVDYGAALGFGLNFGAIQTGATYYLGLQDLTESADANLIFGDANNRVLQIFLCFRLGNYQNEDLNQQK